MNLESDHGTTRTWPTCFGVVLSGMLLIAVTSPLMRYLPFYTDPDPSKLAGYPLYLPSAIRHQQPKMKIELRLAQTPDNP